MKLVKITRKSGIPLIGSIAFGIIDRGTNLIQIRPVSGCNLKCKFCSTNANSDIHPVNYEVELDYLLDYANETVKFKEIGIEANIDSVGEVFCYPRIIELIKGLKRIPNIIRISMQTNGTMIKDVAALEAAGLNQINLSINAISPNLARELSGVESYDIERILALAKIISDSSITLLLAPVWIPGINDAEIPKIIELAKSLNARIGIQKYETYTYSKKIKSGKKISYDAFYKKLAEWEKELGISLVCTAPSFGIEPAKRLPTKLEKGRKIVADIKAPGWQANQALAVAENRCITVNKCKATIGKKVRIRITDNKNNIYMAEKSR